MPYTQAAVAEVAAPATVQCTQRVHDLGCPVESRLDNRLPEGPEADRRDVAVDLAIDAAHIGAFCSRSCPAVDPLLGLVRGAAEADAAGCGDPEGVFDLERARAPVMRRLGRLPAAASEPARHAFLLVRAAYALRQARSAGALWQAVEMASGCWIALRAAVAGHRVVVPAHRRRQILHYAGYVEDVTAATPPLSDTQVEAIIRLSRAAAVWLTEEATERQGDGGTAPMVAAE